MAQVACFLFIIFLQKYFLNGNHKWPTLFVKAVKFEIKKKMLLKWLSKVSWVINGI